MKQHTPGPWEPINSYGGKPAHVTSADGRIANVHWQGGAEQSNTNARLVAASPYLLQTLEAIAGMTVDADTDHAQLSALIMAMAKTAIQATQ